MSSLIRRSIAALAGTTILTVALAGALPRTAAQDGESTKSKAQTPKKKTAKKSEGSSSKSKKAETPAPEEEDEPEAKPKAKGRQAPPDAEHRVPAYFSGLNLTEEQKESIYKIQGNYSPKIQELEKKAAELREKRMSEIEDVLTAPQKKALTEARKAAAARRKAAAKAKVDESEE